MMNPSNVNITQRNQQNVEIDTTITTNDENNVSNSNIPNSVNSFTIKKPTKFNNQIQPITFISPPLLNQNKSQISKINVLQPSREILKVNSAAESSEDESDSSLLSSSTSSMSSFVGGAVTGDNKLRRSKSSSSSASFKLMAFGSKLNPPETKDALFTSNQTLSNTDSCSTESPKLKPVAENQFSISSQIIAENKLNKYVSSSLTSIVSINLDENIVPMSAQESWCKISNDDSRMDYNKIKESLNELSLQAEFKMQGLIPEDETKNQIGTWMSERTNNVTVQTTNRKLPQLNALKPPNNNSQLKNFFRNFNDWRSHMVFYKQIKGYNRPTPEELRSKNAANNQHNEKSSGNTVNENENKPNYSVSVMNPNYKYNKHLITNENYIDQIKQLQSKILQSVEGNANNILPDVKKLPTIKLISNGDTNELLLQGTSNLPPKKTNIGKLQHLSTTNYIHQNNNNINNVSNVANGPSISTGNTDISLQVVNGVPKKVQTVVEQPKSIVESTPSNDKFLNINTNVNPVNTNLNDKISTQSTLNGTLIHLKNRSTTPHKAITNIGFKMEHKPVSNENINQKCIPYTKEEVVENNFNNKPTKNVFGEDKKFIKNNIFDFDEIKLIRPRKRLLGLRAGGGVLRIAPKIDKQNYQFQFTSNLFNNLISESNATNQAPIESVIPYVEPGTENSYYTITSFETKSMSSGANSSNKYTSNSSGSSSGNSDVNSNVKTLTNKQRILALYQRIRDSELETSKSFIIPDDRQKTFLEDRDRSRQKTANNETLTDKIKENRLKNPAFIDQPSLTSFISSNNLIAQSLKNSNSNNNINSSNNRHLAKIKNLNKQLQIQHQEFFYPDTNSGELSLIKDKIKKYPNDVLNSKNTNTRSKMDKSDSISSIPNNKRSDENDEPNQTVENNAPRTTPSFLNVINHRIKYQVAN